MDVGCRCQVGRKTPDVSFAITFGGLRSRSPFYAILVLLFGSGLCALIFQVLWLRQLSLVFGVTIHAASTVLAAFMTGLAVGSLLAGRIAARLRRPLVAFGVVEILIGLSALTTPFGLEVADTLYGALYRVIPDAPVALTLARLAGSFVVLLAPTLLMGLTLPLLSASTLVRQSGFGSRLSALYAANTAGAVTGAIAAGYFLIGSVGMQRTFLLAASINLIVGVLAMLLQRSVVETQQAGVAAEPTPDASSPSRDGRQPGALRRAMLLVVAVSGLASLALEIVWFRMLLQFLTATTYAFTTMLATVLAGIAIGGAISARLLARRRDLPRTLATVLASTGVAVTASAVFLSWTYAAGWRTSGMIQACAAAILPAAICFGIAFPIALRLGALVREGDLQSGPVVARGVGRLYALNVIGAIAGALLGGFVLLPVLGARRALVLLAALSVVTGWAVAASRAPGRKLSNGLVIGTALFVVMAWYVPDPFTAAITRRHGEGFKELWRDEGAQTAVSVSERQGMRVLFLDGVHQADDQPAMAQLHRTIGHLAMVLHPDPRDVLVIGLGGGATAGAASQYSRARVQIVELSESVRRAASHFQHINYNVLERPNVMLRLDDGRNFLKLSGRTFDVITADIIQPGHAGAGSLYSREYFSLVRQALKPGGLALQWIGERPAYRYKLIMRTFLSVFPQATLWSDGALMVGSIDPIAIDPGRLEEKQRDPMTRAALADIGLVTPAQFEALYTAGPGPMHRYVGEGPLLTDDQPLLEYDRSLPRSSELFDVENLRADGR
jgi:spermidine synthase